MIHKDNIPISIFKHKIAKSLGRIFPSKLISTLSNMLAIDFALHINDKPDLSAEDRATKCIDNINNYLSDIEQNFDDSFESATILFSIAISPPHNVDQISSVHQLDSKDRAIDAYIETHISEHSGDEIESMRDALYLLLELGDVNSVFSFITNEPKLFASIASKHTLQFRRVRAQLIANEVLEAYIARYQNVKSSPAANNLTMQSLIQDLAKYTGSKESNKHKVEIAPKGAIAARGVR